MAIFAGVGLSKNKTDSYQAGFEACKTAMESMQKNAKPFFLKTADTILESLNRVKARVDMTEMDSEQKAAVLADLEVKIQAVTEAKTNVEGMPDTATVEDLKQYGKALQDVWKGTKMSLKSSIGQVMVSKLGDIVQKAKQLETKLEKISSKLESKGTDVTKLNAAIANFDAKISEAETSYTEAQVKFKTEDDGPSKHDAVMTKELKDRGLTWRDSEFRKTVREKFRNKPDNPNSYGVLTGESAANYYVNIGRMEVKPKEHIIVFTDGLEKIINSGEFIDEIKQGNFSGMLNVCKKRVKSEGTLVYSRV